MPVSPDTTRLGFVGLGAMGAPMAINLLRAGYRVTVFNRSDRPAVQTVVDAGATRVATPREVAANGDLVITMVSDTPDVEAVVLGPAGVIEGARRGSTLIDMSTISPAATRALAAALAAAGVNMLDAPVSGGEAGARSASLSIMVGGSADTFDACLPVFQTLGRSITWMGPHGAGQATKLCNQVAVAVNNLAMVEALTLATACGLDPERVLNAIAGGAGGSWYLSNMGPRVLAGDFAPGFRVDLQQKDLRLVLGAAGDVKLPLPGVSLVHQLFNLVQRLGGGDEGVQALVKAYETPAGLQVRRGG